MIDGAFPEQLHKSENKENDVGKLAIDHAWNWFKFHAEQRMVLVRFYLIMVGALGAGYASMSGMHDGSIALVIALVGMVVSLLFRRLDLRVSKLIKIGEAVLEKEQLQLYEILKYDEIKIIQRTNEESAGNLTSYRKIFGFMYWSAGFAFLFLGLISLNSIWPSI